MESPIPLHKPRIISTLLVGAAALGIASYRRRQTWFVSLSLIATLWALSSRAAAEGDAVPYPVIVMFETKEGIVDPSLLAPLRYTEGYQKRLQELQGILNANMVDTLSTLVVPTACGQARLTDCTNIHVVTDTKVMETIERIGAPEVLVIRSLAEASKEVWLYDARLHVTLLKIQPQLKVKRAFMLRYQDWLCNVRCIQVSHRYAAEEFRKMSHYMLDPTLPDWIRRQPPAWGKSPRLKDVSRWNNECAPWADDGRLLREDHERAWIGFASRGHDLILASLSWTPCP